jgi:hypothetical protein
VLARMDDTMVDVGRSVIQVVAVDRPNQRRQLDELWPRTDDGDNVHGW